MLQGYAIEAVKILLSVSVAGLGPREEIDEHRLRRQSSGLQLLLT